ncbi:MAG: hypothetical protein V9G20_15030 [Candidatus Promineifilaceae bacterium]
MLKLDKELYRQVYGLHQQWFEAEQQERIRTSHNVHQKKHGNNS